MNSDPRSCRLRIAKLVAVPRRSATSAPVGRVRSSPCHGSHASKTWWRMPVPRVSVRNSVRKPISPRAGTRYSMRAQPVPWFTICCRRPLRSASSCVTTPTYSSGMSIATRCEPVDELRQHLGLADRQFEALAAHQLDEHGELQLAAALHLPGVGPRGG